MTIKKRLLYLLPNLILAVGFSLPALAAKAAPVLVDSIHGGPRIHLRNGTSSNWSGYAAYNGTYKSVGASWVQPTMDCSATPNGYSSYWVGLDGYNDSTVEQIGTEADCSNGVVSYYAWYEMYPQPGYYVNVPVTAGNHFTASVTYSSSRHGGGFTLSLTNHDATSTGGGGGHGHGKHGLVTKNAASFSTTQKSNKAQLASAEAILEAPWSGGVLPLADYQTANFSSVTANGSSIGSFKPNIDPITMDNPYGMISTPSGLNSSGDGFSMTFSL